MGVLRHYLFLAAWTAAGLLAAPGARSEAVTSLREATAAVAASHPARSGFALLDSGASALRIRDALIESAAETIDAQYYIWNSDASGRYVAGRLLAAAERGVHVRVLLDDINVAGRDGVLAGLAAHPNVEIRIYNPSSARSGVLRLLGFVRNFSRLNRRMHNKSFTVDGAVTIIGGRNIGDEYFDVDPVMNFRDRELLAVGPLVPEVSAGFEAFWTSRWTYLAESLATPDGGFRAEGLLAAATAELAVLGYRAAPDLAAEFPTKVFPALIWAPARVVLDEPPDAEQIADHSEQQAVARNLRQLVATARHGVVAESAYLIPGDETLVEAARLHSAGVRLRVLTNSLASNDLVTNHSGYARRRPAMLDAGIEVHELRPDAAACRTLVKISRACDAGPAFSLHSKSLVVDGRVVYVGSFNLNLRSTYLNSETALIVESPELAAQIESSIVELFQPENSWQVRHDSRGRLEWLTEDQGQTVRRTREPMAGLWRRFSARFYRLFPLEKYL